jgi:AcrR family transcriptional regulator
LSCLVIAIYVAQRSEQGSILVINKKSKGGSGGRPASFERQAAVRSALDLFWARGYEGVSIADLTAAIGVAPPSLYHAFGSKAGLFEEAVKLYERSEAGLDLDKLEGAASLEDWIRHLFERAAENVTKSGRACLISNGMVVSHPANRKVAQTLADRRAAFKLAIGEQLRRWLPETDALDLARYLVTILQGLSMQARDGATIDELRPTIALALSAVSQATTRPPNGSSLGT